MGCFFGPAGCGAGDGASSGHPQTLLGGSGNTSSPAAHFGVGAALWGPSPLSLAVRGLVPGTTLLTNRAAPPPHIHGGNGGEGPHRCHTPRRRWRHRGDPRIPPRAARWRGQSDLGCLAGVARRPGPQAVPLPARRLHHHGLLQAAQGEGVPAGAGAALPGRPRHARLRQEPGLARAAGRAGALPGEQPAALPQVPAARGG